MTERVEPVDLGVHWQGNDEDYYLLSSGDGKSVLAIGPAPMPGEGMDTIAIVWTGVREATLGGPNDEALAGHRLYAVGLSNLTWGGVVTDSSRIAALARQNSAHSRHDPASFDALTHWILPLKGDVLEVVALTIAVERRAGTLLQAAIAAISPAR